jgi:alkylmercury lyase
MSERGATPPILPASDLHERVREAAFAMLLADGQPVAIERLATVSGIGDARLAPMLDALADSGRIDRDADGRVTGSAGLSLTTGSHRLGLDAGVFHTWCAYDAIGIPAALAADASVETACAVCRRRIVLSATAGRFASDRPERLWLASGGSDLRGDFCDPTILLCSVEHADAWAERQEGRGRAVEVEEAARLGAAGWASCAAMAARLGAASDVTSSQTGP